MDSGFHSFNNVDKSPSAIRPIKVGFSMILQPTAIPGDILALFLIHHLPKRDSRDILARDTHLPSPLNLQQLKEIPASSTRRNRHLERSPLRKSLETGAKRLSLRFSNSSNMPCLLAMEPNLPHTRTYVRIL